MAMLTAKQARAIRTSKRRINLYYGSVRSGKTHFSLIEWALFVASCPPNSEFLMFGKTLTTLNRNCLRLLQEFEPSFNYSLSAKKGNLYGRTIWLEGANDDRAENKIRGMTLQGAYGDELTLIPETFYSMLLSRLSMKGAKFFATTNPDSPSNYVYTDIIKNDSISKVVVKFTIDDNDFLDPDYVKEIKKEYSGVFYERFILGNFVRAEGVIYKDFADNDRRFTVGATDINVGSIAVISIGIDYGASKAKTTFKAVGIMKGYRDVIILDECDIFDTHEPEIVYSEFHKFYDKVTSRWGRAQYAFADWGGLGNIITNGLITYCQRNRIPVKIQDCEKGRIIDRIQLTTQLMAQDRLKLNSECQYMRQAFLDAVWDADSEDERLDDGTSDIDSLDAFEYAIYPFRENIIKARSSL